MTSLTFLRRTLPFLAAFLMASCGDPTVSYWKKAADINTEYSEKSDALVQRLLKLKKNPTLPGLAESSRDAADLLRERDEELADLSTKDVDPAVAAYVEEDRKLFARGRESQRETPSLVLTPVSGVLTSIFKRRMFSRSARCTTGRTKTPRPHTTLGRARPRPVTTIACVGGAFL